MLLLECQPTRPLPFQPFTSYTSSITNQVMNELGDDFKARVRTVEFTSKLHLVDLAGSERVKRSGVTGAWQQAWLAGRGRGMDGGL